ncbi:MAG: septal ring lytic transglycosylase RlpA family protein [Hyphomicrobiales bacterium]|nr:septal ring lytic transglycosylase RlpA family protein [Hyphomicrobiales bacterium]
MGRQLSSLGFGDIARVGAVALCGFVLAHCSGSFSSKEFSPRVVEEGEPVPKGGGAYRVGKPYNVNGRTYVPAENPSYRIEGIASWYGRDFHGRLTANGEVYDMHSISAAHTTLPMPSYVRVTNLDNGRSIIVRINDRGPYHRNRVIDLSIGTAKALDFYSRGLARVRVEYVGPAPLEGSDDTMLMATLREGSPAPAPSKVMIAAAKPFIANLDDGKDARAASASARPFTLSSASTSVAKSTGDKSAADKSAGDKFAAETPSAKGAKAKSLVRSASAVEPESLPPLEAPPAAFAPMRSEAGTLDLMSGRGLY